MHRILPIVVFILLAATSISAQNATTKLPKCPLYSTLKECGTVCPLTCQRPNPRPCPKICQLNVCECDTGYILNSKQGCVKPEKCECCAARNESLILNSDCPTPCDRTCANRGDICAIDSCGQTGCYCNEGYIRDENDRCILEEECSKTV